MKRVFSLIVFSVIFLLVLTAGCRRASVDRAGQGIRTLVIIGGHSYDTTEFVQMLESISSISFDMVMQPRANRMIAGGEVSDYEVFVFYDMWSSIDSATRSGYLDLLNRGKGFVFLHHSLVSYQEWDLFEQIIGGRYHTVEGDHPEGRLSDYRHDLDLLIHVCDSGHPVTADMQDFMIRDEGYSNISLGEASEVILTTQHPDCSEAVGWVSHFGNSGIVYLMPGHDKLAYENDSFRKLLENSIRFVSSGGISQGNPVD